jgi:hypothetical protein
VPESAETTPSPDAEEGAKEGAQFGKLTPSQAASLRWQRVKERQAAGLTDVATEHANEVKWVRVPVRVGTIIQRLVRDASKGDVGAARELRSWLSEVEEEGTETSQLDTKTRQAMLDRLLADIEAEEEGGGHPRDEEESRS